LYREFEVHRLNERGLGRAELVAQVFDHALETLVHLWDGYNSRESAVCRTKLEEACFFAKKAVAVRGANQA
jgi:hypothetical protein